MDTVVTKRLSFGQVDSALPEGTRLPPELDGGVDAVLERLSAFERVAFSRLSAVDGAAREAGPGASDSELSRLERQFGCLKSSFLHFEAKDGFLAALVEGAPDGGEVEAKEAFEAEAEEARARLKESKLRNAELESSLLEGIGEIEAAWASLRAAGEGVRARAGTLRAAADADELETRAVEREQRERCATDVPRETPSGPSNASESVPFGDLGASGPCLGGAPSASAQAEAEAERARELEAELAAEESRVSALRGALGRAEAQAREARAAARVAASKREAEREAARRIQSERDRAAWAGAADTLLAGLSGARVLRISGGGDDTPGTIRVRGERADGVVAPTLHVEIELRAAYPLRPVAAPEAAPHASAANRSESAPCASAANRSESAPCASATPLSETMPFSSAVSAEAAQRLDEPANRNPLFEVGDASAELAGNLPPDSAAPATEAARSRAAIGLSSAAPAADVSLDLDFWASPLPPCAVRTATLSVEVTLASALVSAYPTPELPAAAASFGGMAVAGATLEPAPTPPVAAALARALGAGLAGGPGELGGIGRPEASRVVSSEGAGPDLRIVVRAVLTAMARDAHAKALVADALPSAVEAQLQNPEDPRRWTVATPAGPTLSATLAACWPDPQGDVWTANGRTVRGLSLGNALATLGKAQG